MAPKIYNSHRWASLKCWDWLSPKVSLGVFSKSCPFLFWANKKHLFHFSKTIHLQSFKRVPHVLVIIKSKAKAKVELSHELNTSDQVKTSKWMQDFKFYNMLQSFLVQSSIYSYPQNCFLMRTLRCSICLRGVQVCTHCWTHPKIR